MEIGEDGPDHLDRTRADLRHRRGGGRGERGLLHRVGGDHSPRDDARTDARGGLPNPAARDRPLRRGGGRAGACLRDLAGRAVGREGDLPLDDASSGGCRGGGGRARADLRVLRTGVGRIRTPPAGRERGRCRREEHPRGGDRGASGLGDGAADRTALRRADTYRAARAVDHAASLDLERPESPLQLDGRRRGDLDGTRLHLYALRQRSEETAFHGDGQLGRTCGGGGERGEVDRRGACDGGVQRRMLRRRGGFPASGHAVQRSDVDEGLRIYAGARPVHQ